jgi:hypothetical protein
MMVYDEKGNLLDTLKPGEKDTFRVATDEGVYLQGEGNLESTYWEGQRYGRDFKWVWENLPPMDAKYFPRVPLGGTQVVNPTMT